jgi:hypothetical protein
VGKTLLILGLIDNVILRLGEWLGLVLFWDSQSYYLSLSLSLSSAALSISLGVIE